MRIEERNRAARRLDAYGRLLEITTDKLAREAIEHQRTRLVERMRQIDAEAAPEIKKVSRFIRRAISASG